ncbi:hypothetical protein PVK64_05735 [Aliivibrio sp. S4TY2]|uniref:hypothetical protein n=1 Tax=unclassified Aliivibrio TaxID=2645654 RepID=UPI0023799CE3|nr:MULTISPECIES: hypothetical protein [unclassified Aliivibrio]MDD9155685.1 hypothetical protein [Aliivibrio sp. S4TY2]MDD9159635.1 hypothetical protein [Aliivibrio sp. S4TY1]MDD9163394.1 hypothetical protein [Aliivibrio sp. S4MY2]MDD9167394.1 hypothetical protein [Aliivibrio sp. S4MY4]MDD9186287.1 hypothetical protein [Aliivibrio sp. S4MY3]
MKFKLLAAATALLAAPSLMAATTLDMQSAMNFVDSNDTVNLTVSGNIPVKCVMTFMDISAASNYTTLDLTVAGAAKTQVGEVLVWCNDGQGRANIEVTSTNSGKLINNEGGEIDYLFRFHENNNNTGIVSDKFFPIDEPQDLVESIWTSNNGGAFDPELVALSPQSKKLYVKPVGLTGMERAGDYSDIISLTISPIQL